MFIEVIALRLIAMVALCVAEIFPAHGADVAAAGLVGCWRNTSEGYGENARRVILSDGDEGRSYGIDPSTGQEILGRVPYVQLCFRANAIVVSTNMGFDEGRETSGSYQFDGRRLSVHDDYDYPDAWLFGSRDVDCLVRIEGDVLTVASCGGGDKERAEMNFVRRPVHD